jgi:hypothetical protein
MKLSTNMRSLEIFELKKGYDLYFWNLSIWNGLKNHWNKGKGVNWARPTKNSVAHLICTGPSPPSQQLEALNVQRRAHATPSDCATQSPSSPSDHRSPPPRAPWTSSPANAVGCQPTVAGPYWVGPTQIWPKAYDGLYQFSYGLIWIKFNSLNFQNS